MRKAGRPTTIRQLRLFVLEGPTAMAGSLTIYHELHPVDVAAREDDKLAVVDKFDFGGVATGWSIPN